MGAGLFLIGMSYGMVTGELTAFADSNEMMTQVISGMGADLADGFVTLLSGIMAIMMSVPLMGCVTRMAAEEKRGRMELVLSAAVPRVKLYGSFVLVACLEAVILALLSVFGFCSTALSSGLVTFETVLNAMLVYIPALLVMTGLAAFLVGWLPKLTALVWIAFCGAFILFFFGRIIDMPEMVLRLSPFGNTPQYPVQEVPAMPLVIMCAVAGLLMAVGAVGYKKRDI